MTGGEVLAPQESPSMVGVNRCVALAATDHRAVDCKRERPRDHGAAEQRFPEAEVGLGRSPHQTLSRVPGPHTRQDREPPVLSLQGRERLGRERRPGRGERLGPKLRGRTSQGETGRSAGSPRYAPSECQRGRNARRELRPLTGSRRPTRPARSQSLARVLYRVSVRACGGRRSRPRCWRSQQLCGRKVWSVWHPRRGRGSSGPASTDRLSGSCPCPSCASLPCSSSPPAAPSASRRRRRGRRRRHRALRRSDPGRCTPRAPP